MASPISFTIELSRCWTTERVMGSIVADILALLFALEAPACTSSASARRHGERRIGRYLIVAAGDV